MTTVLLSIVGGILLFLAIRWRLNQIEAIAASKVGAGRGSRGRTQPGARAIPGPRKAKTDEEETLELAKILRASAPVEEESSPRRTERVMMKIPLEVSAKDAHGRTFTERTHTQLLNRNGASMLLRHVLASNSPVTIKNLESGQTCRFRVRNSSAELPGGLREWGVELLDPVPNFWRISFMDSDVGGGDQSIGSLLECLGCHCREMTKLTMEEYSALVSSNTSVRPCKWCERDTDWKFVVIEDDSATSSPAAKAGAATPETEAEAERRRADRRVVRMPVAIRHQDGREEKAVTENVSRTGICCAARMELAAGERAFLRLISEQGVGQAEFRAIVMWRRRMQETSGVLYGMKMERSTPRASAAN
jgi:hypothetical protein